MESLLNKLAEYANLTIVDFDVTVRNELEVRNRLEPYSIMTYLEKGNANIKIADEVYEADAGTAVIIPSNIEHDHIQTTSETSVFLWWHFHFTIAGSIDMLKLLNLPIMFKMINQREFERVFKKYNQLAKKPNTFQNTILKKAKSLEVMALIFDSAIKQSESHLDKDIPQIYMDIFPSLMNITIP